MHKGLDVISLGIEDRPLASKEVLDTLFSEAAKENSHSYQPCVGLPALRKAFADWYRICPVPAGA